MTHGSRTANQLSACFFARVSDGRQIETVEFYAQDVAFLRELGFRVRVVTRNRDLFSQRPHDLYFCWWWTSSYLPVALARIFHRPSIVTGTFNHHLYAQRPAYQRRVIAWTASHASANVFVSNVEKVAVTSLIAVSRPSVSPHTVDTRLYAPGTSKRDPNLLLSVAHLGGGNSIRKCVAESLRALARLAESKKEIRLVIAGERGSDYADLARLAGELGLGERVSFPGRVTRAEKIRLMQTCVAYLQPSRFEGFGLAGLEAMACGAPVVTSPVGAVPEVGGDVVIYVNGEAPEQIAEAVGELLDHPTKREAIGKAARARAVREFSPQRRLDDLADVLRSIGIQR